MILGKIRKILILAHPEMDHLAYMMYDGLYKVLGNTGVYIYPYVKHYQGQGQVDDWYILDDGKKGYTVAPGYISKHDTPQKSLEGLVREVDIKSYDIIYISSGRTYAIKALDQIVSAFGIENLPPLVFSEGEDYQDISTIERIKQKYNPVACFKRELLPQDLEKRKDLYPLYPLPFAAITDNIPPDNPNKDIDVFVLFGNTNQLRENIVKTIGSSHLPQKYKIHVGIDRFSNEPEKVPWQDQTRFTIPPMMPYRIYMELMSRAKINIIARGWGYDSLRRFEAPLFSGIVLSDILPIITPNPFIDNQHIIYYNHENIGELVGRIEYLLAADNERKRIGEAGRNHCLQYHTTEARARYFLDKVELHL